MTLPLPPYARSAQVVSDCVWIRCGPRGWRYLREHPQAGEIVYPADGPADRYDWSFVAGLDVWVVGGDAPHGHVVGLVVALLLADASVVHVIDKRFTEASRAGLATFRLTDLTAGAECA